MPENYDRAVEVYHEIYDRGLDLIRKNKLPVKIILKVLDEYAEKYRKSIEVNIEPDVSEDLKPLILLAAQEQLLNDRIEMEQQLIDVREGYEEVLTLITHEFKNLLTTVQGYNVLIEKKLHDENQEDLLDIHYSSDRVIHKLFHMVDAILKMSLSEKNLLKPDYRLVDFNKDILIPLEDEQEHELNKKQMTLQKNIRTKKTMIMADEQLIEIVMRNLLENAIRYGDHGSNIDLTVEKIRSELVVTIKNYCNCLPDNICDGIFEKFKTVKVSNIKAGTGIGLYNVKNLIKLHYGNIACTSSSGKWIKFKFNLPLK